MDHRWHFFRAGGVDQVSLRDGNDLKALARLDPKLWVALAMPVVGIDLDPETLALLDPDKDGRVRKDDILAAVDWIVATFKDPGELLHSETSVKLAALADPKIVAAAKRILSDLGKPDSPTISIEHTIAVSKAFADTVLNGDGIIIPEGAGTPDARRAIEDIIACTGSVTDRSGKPGIDAALAAAFFADVDLHVAWQRAAHPPGTGVSADSADAFGAVRTKLHDYFIRCEIAAFDPRGHAALGGQDAELVALGGRILSSGDDELAKLPLARIQTEPRLALTVGLNPAWAQRLAAFIAKTLTPIVGARELMTPADLTRIIEALAPFETWRAAKPVTKVDKLDAAWLEQLAAPGLRATVTGLIAADAALAAEYDQFASVMRAVRFQRDFGRILRNFVSFSDFYAKKDGVFQAGTLYLDGRAMHLTVPVIDGAKHTALAGSSDAYLVYCDITRGAEKSQIAVAITNGDSDNVFVGRNGVFYDRKGHDWDATIARIVGNPISVRQAFWSPYKKLAKVIEDNITKRAQGAEAKSLGTVEAAGAVVADPVAPPAKKIDLGTVAAIGVAIGGIGTLFGALLATMFGLGPWLPLGILAILLMISAPSMLLAWLKLRRRNLGPILDANGWAINGRARVNVAFGAALTELATLPKGAMRSLDDPFADKRTPWKRWVFLIVLVLLAGTWFVGKLDRYLPKAATSLEVLGTHAPAYVAPPAAPAPAAAHARPRP